MYIVLYIVTCMLNTRRYDHIYKPIKTIMYTSNHHLTMHADIRSIVTIKFVHACLV